MTKDNSAIPRSTRHPLESYANRVHLHIPQKYYLHRPVDIIADILKELAIDNGPVLKYKLYFTKV